MVAIMRSLALMGTLFFALPVMAQERHALVVGIDNYISVPPLQKARNDARSVHEALSNAGFASSLISDPGQLELLTAVNEFSMRVQSGDEVVFFFAGHGVEIDGRNYLLPADVPEVLPGGELLVTARALALDTMLGVIEARGVRVSLFIVDACRDNPFPQQGTRSLGGGRGLGRVAEAPEGTFILFSAGQGQAALDRLSDNDPNPNSVFTRVLLPRLAEPGLLVHEMARAVRTEVRQLARTIGREQFPAVYDQFDGSFALVPVIAPSEIETVPDLLPEQTDPLPLAGTSTVDPCVAILPVWEALAESGDPDALEAFAASYASSCLTLATLARSRASASRSTTPLSSTLDSPAENKSMTTATPKADANYDSILGTSIGEVSIGSRLNDLAAGTELAQNGNLPQRNGCTATDEEIATLFQRYRGISPFETFIERHPSCSIYRGFVQSALYLKIGQAMGDKTAEDSLNLSRLARQRIQTMLNDLGFDSGAPDGILGSSTRSAIAEFTLSISKQRSEYLNDTTLQHLRDMHRLVPEKMDGRWSLTFYRQSGTSPPESLQTLIVDIKDGRVGNYYEVSRHRLQPITVNRLEIDNYSGFIFNAEIHYLFSDPQPRSESTKISTTIQVSGRQLVGHERTFKIGVFDRNWRAIVKVARVNWR